VRHMGVQDRGRLRDAALDHPLLTRALISTNASLKGGHEEGAITKRRVGAGPPDRPRPPCVTQT
jgi:hypothetical protein